MDRNTYASNLASLAMQIVGAVHFGGPAAVQAAIGAARSLTAPRDIHTEDAIIVILAAIASPDQTRSGILTTVRRLDGDPLGLVPGKPSHYRSNLLAVEMAIRGALPASALNPRERVDVIESLRARGLTREQIAHHLNSEPHHVDQWAGHQTHRTAA
ncbi:hypothetical protein [Kibdelosporangium phytohabitans]|uniref:Uncharacterized protein n=1 Tax=Kibdelosporangium phytohabitans TaxID=860235 RepID=A0A0N9HS01_9PSEU|nr:hypothetical protein [Kibdelosporangium phytohabitans]ALG07636.1 hypothetical protein AOZ06_12615 [Kibdelosporangium phytohabitans]ALG07692.1 hypothetical protein AOZ06_12935 [Kibdelosporangium phytohabitans]MBE1471410.1 hypothetical protein [Kibdelosporangium phytohabitans]